MKILYLSSVYYKWLKQRPQFIAKYLSEKTETAYVSFTPFGRKIEKTTKQDEELRIFDLKVLPGALNSKLVRLINKLYFNIKIKPQKFDVIVITHPVQIFYVPKNTKIIYECIDNVAEFYKGRKKATVKDAEGILCKKAKHIIVSAEALKTKLQKEHKVGTEKISVIFNAFDSDWLRKESGKIKLKKNNMVYVGTIDSWIDFSVLKDYFSNHKNDTLYMVGTVKTNIEKLNLPENIVFTGKVSHYDVKGYIKEAETVLIPFKINNLTKYVDPVKMYEYIAMGKKIISSYWEELDKFKEYNVHFYSNVDDFEECVCAEKEKSKDYKQFILEHCWEKRIDNYINLLSKI